jgi:hypothetical protein
MEPDTPCTPEGMNMQPQPYLVVPEGGEDEVHLDEDGAKGQQAAHEGDHPRLQVPVLDGDGRGDALHTAGVVRQPIPVAPHHLLRTQDLWITYISLSCVQSYGLCGPQGL